MSERRKDEIQPYLLLFVIGALCALRMVAQVVVASPAIHNEAPELFSTQWLEEYAKGSNGCTMARGSYIWRKSGFGSNINNLLNAWVWTLSVKQWEDVALVNDPSLMDQLDCTKYSNGQVSSGWNCLFSPMPHLCEFNSTEEWAEYMQSRGVSHENQKEAVQTRFGTVRKSRVDVIPKSLESAATDYFGSLSVMADYLWSQLTPWIKDDIRNVTCAESVAAVNDVPLVGIHVRRGDKVKHHEAESYGAEQYLAAGVESMLQSEGGLSWVESIKALWIASDDPHAIDEVRKTYPHYFPNVEPGLIVWISGGVEGALETMGVVTRTTGKFLLRYPGSWATRSARPDEARDLGISLAVSNVARGDGFLPGTEDRVTLPGTSRMFTSRASRRCIIHHVPSRLAQGYPAYVYMFADLEQLVKAELFVGTFSSNVGRLAALLREAAGKPLESSVSIDIEWVPGRMRAL